MTPDEIEAVFTRADGQFNFARWGRPIAPVVVGVDDATLAIVKGAVEAVVRLAGHEMAETDPELGANLMVFFLSDWDELLEVPNLDQLIPDLKPLVGRLKLAQANQYRAFRFEDSGAIKASFVFVRVDDVLAEMPAEAVALAQMVQIILAWSDVALQARPPLARDEVGEIALHPDYAALIRAAYDPVLPVATQDKTHALRLFARTQAG